MQDHADHHPVHPDRAAARDLPRFRNNAAYTLFGLDALGGEIEEPFGLDPNDLPLAPVNYCLT